MKTNRIALCIGLFLLVCTAMTGQIMPPKGNVGIAANYPGDLGIENDPDVILAEGFESYNNAGWSDLGRNWDLINQQHMSIITDSENVISGEKALQMSLPKQNADLYVGIDLYLTEEQKQDVIYIRYYHKLEDTYNIPKGVATHNGGCISSRYWTTPNGSGPGYCANGTNKYLAMFQNVSEHYECLGIYTYHPYQRYNDIPPVWVDPGRPATASGKQWGDYLFPNGEVMPWTYWRGNYGSDFIVRDNFTIEFGRWYCYELMLKANTPGKRDGRITAWVDGEIMADFGNMRFRDISDLKIDLVGFSLGCASNPVAAAKGWFDNIVIAKSYIGPIYDSYTNKVNDDGIAALPKITGYYNVMGIKLPKEPASGMYIIKYDDGTAEKKIKIKN